MVLGIRGMHRNADENGEVSAAFVIVNLILQNTTGTTPRPRWSNDEDRRGFGQRRGSFGFFASKLRRHVTHGFRIISDSAKLIGIEKAYRVRPEAISWVEPF